MRLLSRLPLVRRRPGEVSRDESKARTLAHFRQFVSTRQGVEAYLEPPTRNDPVTVVLIAETGEWTRRRVPDARTGRALAKELGVPVYDVMVTGYPPRMRRWNSRNKHR